MYLAIFLSCLQMLILFLMHLSHQKASSSLSILFSFANKAKHCEYEIGKKSMIYKTLKRRMPFEGRNYTLSLYLLSQPSMVRFRVF
jgi:hypothetical protein